MRGILHDALNEKPIHTSNKEAIGSGLVSISSLRKMVL